MRSLLQDSITGIFLSFFFLMQQNSAAGEEVALPPRTSLCSGPNGVSDPPAPSRRGTAAARALPSENLRIRRSSE